MSTQPKLKAYYVSKSMYAPFDIEKEKPKALVIKLTSATWQGIKKQATQLMRREFAKYVTICHEAGYNHGVVAICEEGQQGGVILKNYGTGWWQSRDHILNHVSKPYIGQLVCDMLDERGLEYPTKTQDFPGVL